MDIVRVSPDRWGFWDGHARVVPWGCNYYDPFTGWAPRLWERFDARRVAEQLDQLRAIGANVVRVFSTLAATLESDRSASPPCRANEAGIAKIVRMLELAASRGIRVILSGPGGWEGFPAWWQSETPLEIFVKPDLLAAQAVAWGGIATALKGNPGLFAYELHNEPCIPWQATPAMRELWAAWRRDGSPGTPDDLPSPQDPLRLEWTGDLQRFREELAVRYVRRMTEAIREFDTTHLVTLGMHQKSAPFDWYPPDPWAAFNPHRLADLLDYASVHFYPHHVFHPNLYRDPFETDQGMEETLAHARAVARYVWPGNAPVVMEECGWYGGGPVLFADREQRELTEEQQTAWCTRLVEATRGDVCGWLFWPYRDTPSALDPSRRSGLYDETGRLKDWGKAFARLAPRITGSPPVREPGTVRLAAPLAELTTDPARIKSFRAAYLAEFRAGRVVDFGE